MRLVLDVENTVTKRDGKVHLDPFEPGNHLVQVGYLDADDSRLHSSHTDLGDALEAFNQLINQRDWSTVDQSVSLIDSEKDLCMAIYALQDFNYGALT